MEESMFVESKVWQLYRKYVCCFQSTTTYFKLADSDQLADYLQQPCYFLDFYRCFWIVVVTLSLPKICAGQAIE